MQSGLRSRWLVAAALGALGASCGYDFDAPFSQGWSGADAGTDSAAEVGPDVLPSGGHAGAAGASGWAGGAGQGGSGGAAGGAASGGTAGASAAGGGGATEDCTNGVDDDADGKADCADDACTDGFVCVPEGPGGMWAGSAFMFQEFGSGSAPDCGDGFTLTRTFSGFIPSYLDTCACSCAAPAGGTCEPEVTLFTLLGCGGIPYSLGSGCFGAMMLPLKGFTGSVTVNSGGACAAQVSPAFKEPSWMTERYLCEPTARGGGCQSGSVCVPKPAKPSAAACVFADGDLSCPTGYGTAHHTWRSYLDTRACAMGQCSCSVPSGVTCSGVVRQFQDSSCSTIAGPDVPIDGTCRTLDSVKHVYAATTAEGGSCKASGLGSKLGTVEQVEAVTICCP